MKQSKVSNFSAPPPPDKVADITKPANVSKLPPPPDNVANVTDPTPGHCDASTSVQLFAEVPVDCPTANKRQSGIVPKSKKRMSFIETIGLSRKLEEASFSETFNALVIENVFNKRQDLVKDIKKDKQSYKDLIEKEKELKIKRKADKERLRKLDARIKSISKFNWGTTETSNTSTRNAHVAVLIDSAIERDQNLLEYFLSTSGTSDCFKKSLDNPYLITLLCILENAAKIVSSKKKAGEKLVCVEILAAAIKSANAEMSSTGYYNFIQYFQKFGILTNT